MCCTSPNDFFFPYGFLSSFNLSPFCLLFYAPWTLIRLTTFFFLLVSTELKLSLSLMSRYEGCWEGRRTRLNGFSSASWDLIYGSAMMLHRDFSLDSKTKFQLRHDYPQHDIHPSTPSLTYIYISVLPSTPTPTKKACETSWRPIGATPSAGTSISLAMARTDIMVPPRSLRKPRV